MLNNLIVYCALNTRNANTTDGIDGLIDRLFEAITNAPDTCSTTTDIDTTEAMSWHDHQRAFPRFAQTLYDVSWTYGEWVQDFINWRPGDCSWLGQASPIVGECYFGFGYRECRAGRELFYEHSLQTCGHE